MRFLFVSKWALIHDLAGEVAKEGHEVRYAILSKNDKDVADGFVEKIDDWKAQAEEADVIVFDDCGFGEEAERLRKAGKAVVGGTRASDRLEEDRDFGQEEMKSAGLVTLPNWDFDSFDAAIAFVKKTPDRYVVKPNGKAQNDKVLSFVGQEEDGRDIVTMLEHYKRGWGSKIRSFQLQKYASGVEVAIGAFFNGKEFILPALVNFEHKRMFNDDIGPSTGEMGTASFWSGETRLFRETLGRMKSRIQGYVGYIDINCIVNSRGIHPSNSRRASGIRRSTFRSKACCPNGATSSRRWPGVSRSICGPSADSRSPSSWPSPLFPSSTPTRSESSRRTRWCSSRGRPRRGCIPAT